MTVEESYYKTVALPGDSVVHFWRRGGRSWIPVIHRHLRKRWNIVAAGRGRDMPTHYNQWDVVD
jgi:hypothetical protein